MYSHQFAPSPKPGPRLTKNCTPSRGAYPERPALSLGRRDEDTRRLDASTQTICLKVVAQSPSQRRLRYTIDALSATFGFAAGAVLHGCSVISRCEPGCDHPGRKEISPSTTGIKVVQT